VRVLEDCVAGNSVELHEASLLIMRSLVSAEQAFNSTDLLAELGAATS
jgi:hypothetical protein